MSIQFKWEEKYAVGDPVIDQEHKNMFELANTISEDMDIEEIKGVIDRLFDYSREHFMNEEKMMETNGYDKHALHRVQHQVLTTKLAKMKIRSFDTDKSKFEFRKFIYDWMIDHLLNHDRDFFQFLQERNADNNK